MKLDEYDVIDLAGYICGLDIYDCPLKTVNKNSPYDEGDCEEQEYEDAVEEALYDKFEINLASFAVLMTKLLPMIDIGDSPISKEKFKGFSVSLGGDKRQFLLKTKIKAANPLRTSSPVEGRVRHRRQK